MIFCVGTATGGQPVVMTRPAPPTKFMLRVAFMPPPLSTERESMRKACALTISRHEKALTTHRTMKEIVWVTRAAIEHSRDLMAWANLVLKGRA